MRKDATARHPNIIGQTWHWFAANREKRIKNPWSCLPSREADTVQSGVNYVGYEGEIK